MDAVKVIDELMRADRENQRRRKIIEGAEDLKRWTKKRCGNCHKWMKSSLCPAEKNVNGYSRGPNADDPTASYCKSFVISPLKSENAEKERAQLVQKAAEYGMTDLLPAELKEQEPAS